MSDDGEVNQRVAKLETHFEYIRRDLDAIMKDQRAILDRTVRLPTVGNLWTMIATVAAIALAVIGIFVGILTYLQTAPSGILAPERAAGSESSSQLGSVPAPSERSDESGAPVKNPEAASR